jgi:GT2 family glycosyltransferase
MLEESDYDRDRVDVVVVDNASGDGTAEMLREEFPDVTLIRREENAGVSAWNDGFAVATGDYVLALDDDCYLPPDGLRLAIDGAHEHDAQLVSFAVRSSYAEDYRFDDRYRTGLLSFWGCAVLIRRDVLSALRGFDPEIFIWAHELEFMLRFFDRGFRHLHMPEVAAVHMKAPGRRWPATVGDRAYRVNAEHWAYIAGKLLRPRDAVEALVAIVTTQVRDGLKANRAALGAPPRAFVGFARGLRHRAPVKNAEISRFYRHNFQSFLSPWWISRTPAEFALALPRKALSLVTGREYARPEGRRDAYYDERAAIYPSTAATLEFDRS